MQRERLLGCAVVALAVATGAQAIDFSGRWNVAVHFTSPITSDAFEQWTVVLSGTQLTVTIGGGSPLGGFIDPVSDHFQVFHPAPPPFPIPCSGGVDSGTLAADGETFTAARS